MGSWLGLSPREGACPGLESELSWGVSWLDMEEPEGRMGALLNRAGEKSLQRKKNCLQIFSHIFQKFCWALCNFVRKSGTQVNKRINCDPCRWVFSCLDLKRVLFVIKKNNFSWLGVCQCRGVLCFPTLCPAERYRAEWFVFCHLRFSSPPASSEGSGRKQIQHSLHMHSLYKSVF